MNKLNFYRTAAIVLLIINLSVIGFFIFTKGGDGHPHNRKGEFKHQAFKILKLDDEQKKLFSESADKHHKMMKGLNRKQSRILQEYFKGLNDGINETEKADFIVEYNELETNKITGTYNHFEEVKNFLRPEQMGYYKGFVEKAVRRLLSNNSEMPTPPRHR